MIRPRIGLNCDLGGGGAESRMFLKRAYAHRVVAAGGVPVPLDPDAGPGVVSELFALVHGVVLTGGDDYRPERYGDAECHPALELVLPERDDFDFAMIEALQRTDIPVLGLCNGMQLMAIAAGGRLHQHLPEAIGETVRHKDPAPGAYPEHRVTVVAGTRLATLLGEGEQRVNTRHHQGVADAGDLVVSALSDDGLIEALERKGERFYLGVQWHPEESSAGQPGQALFDALVEAARGGPMTEKRNKRRTRPELLEEISQLELTQEALERSQQELERANRELAGLHIAKDEFMAAVSHELRTPLVTGLGYVDLLLEGSLGQLSAEARKAMEVAARSLRRLASLVDDTLTYHSLLRGDLHSSPSPEEFDIEQLVRESVAEIVIRMGLSMDSVHVEPAEPLPPVVADREMIRRVLSNLLDNALRHGGELARPALALRLVEDDKIEVAVRDQGKGIPAAVREQAFEPFSKAVPSGEGSGLGLAIVRSILDAHGQEVALQSEKGRGTCVVFHLPTAGAGAAAAVDQRSAEEARILVLEDDRDTADFLRLALSAKGYRVYTARSGGEALSRLDTDPVDLCLVDLQLPGMAGEEFCRRVRGRSDSAEMPLYLMTGRSEQEAREQARAAGCDGYLIKPVALDQLVRLIRERLAGVE